MALMTKKKSIFYSSMSAFMPGFHMMKFRFFKFTSFPTLPALVFIAIINRKLLPIIK